MIGVIMDSGVFGRDDTTMFRAEFTNAAQQCDGLANPLLYANMRPKNKHKNTRVSFVGFSVIAVIQS